MAFARAPMTSRRSVALGPQALSLRPLDCEEDQSHGQPSTRFRWRGSLFQPDILQPPAVIHAVGHCRQTLEPRVPTRRATGVKDDRSRAFLLQAGINIPHQRLALFLVGLSRLLMELLFQLAVAVAGEVAVRIASVALVKLLVGIIDD